MTRDDPSPRDTEPAVDEDYEAALKEILNQVMRERRLTGNQILRLSAELQRLGIHRLIEDRTHDARSKQSA